MTNLCSEEQQLQEELPGEGFCCFRNSPFFSNLSGSRLNADFWRYAVYCAKVSFEGGAEAPVHCPEQWSDVKENFTAWFSEDDEIVAYQEHRHMFPFGQNVPLKAPLGLHHGLLLIEVRRRDINGEYAEEILNLGDRNMVARFVQGGNSIIGGCVCPSRVLYIVMEKFNDKMELMYGDKAAIVAALRDKRASGEQRPVSDTRPLLAEAWVRLPHPKALGDLSRWIDEDLGPMWHPYNLLGANCQLFVMAAQEFLNDDGITAPTTIGSHSRVVVARDRRRLIEALRIDGMALQHAPRSLTADSMVVSAAVTCSGSALQYASDDLKGNLRIVLAAVRNNGNSLKHVDAVLQSAPLVVHAAVEQHGLALQYAAPELRADRSIVYKAVRNSGIAALQYASPDLQADALIWFVASYSSLLCFLCARMRFMALFFLDAACIVIRCGLPIAIFAISLVMCWFVILPVLSFAWRFILLMFTSFADEVRRSIPPGMLWSLWILVFLVVVHSLRQPRQNEETPVDIPSPFVDVAINVLVLFVGSSIIVAILVAPIVFLIMWWKVFVANFGF